MSALVLTLSLAARREFVVDAITAATADPDPVPV
jgi:hypothetical protein